MKAGLIGLGVLNLLFAFLVPPVALSDYATTATTMIATYPRQGAPPDEFSAAERSLLKSIEQRSANRAFLLVAVFAIQGLVLIAYGLALPRPPRDECGAALTADR